MSSLSLALLLSLSPAAAPDDAAVSSAAIPSTTQARQKTDTGKKKRRAKRRARQRELSEVLALSPPTAPLVASTPKLPAAPAIAPSPSPVKAGSPPSLVVPKTALNLGALMWPGLLLCLGAGALVFFRRKSTSGRSLDVVESVSVGKGRDLVVVDVAGSRMLLGCTDGGIAVLEKALPRHAPRVQPSGPQSASHEGSVAAALSTAFRNAMSRLKTKRRSTAAFERHLEATDGVASSEQEDLARKLKARMGTREVTSPGFNLNAQTSTRGKAVRA